MDANNEELRMKVFSRMIAALELDAIVRRVQVRALPEGEFRSYQVSRVEATERVISRMKDPDCLPGDALLAELLGAHSQLLDEEPELTDDEAWAFATAPGLLPFIQNVSTELEESLLRDHGVVPASWELEVQGEKE